MLPGFSVSLFLSCDLFFFSVLEFLVIHCEIRVLWIDSVLHLNLCNEDIQDFYCIVFILFLALLVTVLEFLMMHCELYYKICLEW